MRYDRTCRSGYRDLRRIRTALAFASVAAPLLAVLASGCASHGPAVEALRASGSARAGPGESYRVEKFRIGWYDSIRNPETPARLAALGFDSVLPYTTGSSIENIRSYLSAAEAADIGVHVDVTRGRSLEKSGVLLEQYVRALKDSPAVLSWYLADEPEWRLQSTPRKLESAYSRIKALDSVRPVSLVFILPGFSGAYRGAMDSLWIDWYPVIKGSREFAALREGRYADRMKAFGRRADRYGLPLTIVPQGYGEDEEGQPQFRRRLPTAEETRYMFWASFLARPEEIVFWTLYRTREDWLEGSLVPVVREFRDRFPDAVEYLPEAGFRIEGGRVDSMLLGNGRGGLWLLVLSREGRERTLGIRAPDGYDLRDGIDGADREVPAVIGPFEVLLLEISEIP